MRVTGCFYSVQTEVMWSIGAPNRAAAFPVLQVLEACNSEETFDRI